MKFNGVLQNEIKYFLGLGLLQTNKNTLRVFVRYSNRINVGKPRPPHYRRAKIEHLVAPKYFEKNERESWFLPLASQCMKEDELKWREKDKNVVSCRFLLLCYMFKHYLRNSFKPLEHCLENILKLCLNKPFT